MRTTLKDVAERANVSIKTASNVVNNQTQRVGPETRRRVLEAIEALGYRPNLAARQLRNSRVGIIALALPDLQNPYFAGLARAIVEAGAAADYLVLVDHTNGDRDKETMVVRGLRPGIIDGIIFDPTTLDEDDLHGLSMNLPVVLLGERLLTSPFDHVLIDNAAAAFAATTHLIEIGRRRIAIVGVPNEPSLAMPQLRLQGYGDALTAAGRGIDPDLIVPPVMKTFAPIDGALTLRRLMAMPDPPDAVFCVNDQMAIGAIRAAWELGVRVPEDIAILGIDGITDGEFSTPSLTTIAPDKQAIAALSVRLLIERIEGRSTEEPRVHQIPFRLIVRESTAGRHDRKQTTGDESDGAPGTDERRDGPGQRPSRSAVDRD